MLHWLNPNCMSVCVCVCVSVCVCISVYFYGNALDREKVQNYTLTRLTTSIKAKLEMIKIKERL